MEAVSTSKTSFNIYQTARRNIRKTAIFNLLFIPFNGAPIWSQIYWCGNKGGSIFDQRTDLLHTVDQFASSVWKRFSAC
jgi:hypothetical protein